MNEWRRERAEGGVRKKRQQGTRPLVAFFVFFVFFSRLVPILSSLVRPPFLFFSSSPSSANQHFFALNSFISTQPKRKKTDSLGNACLCFLLFVHADFFSLVEKKKETRHEKKQTTALLTDSFLLFHGPLPPFYL